MGLYGKCKKIHKNNRDLYKQLLFYACYFRHVYFGVDVHLSVLFKLTPQSLRGRLRRDLRCLLAREHFVVPYQSRGALAVAWLMLQQKKASAAAEAF